MPGPTPCGSNGLIGSEAAVYFGALGLEIVGIDNNMREIFFGPDGSTVTSAGALFPAPKPTVPPPIGVRSPVVEFSEYIRS